MSCGIAYMTNMHIAYKSLKMLKFVYFAMRLVPLELAGNVILVICDSAVVQTMLSVYGFLRFLSV